MSELINTRQPNFRKQLLTTASALAFAFVAVEAAASEDRPTVWIELGAQAERLAIDQMPFAPDFVANYAASDVFQTSPPAMQKLPKYGIGGQAKISISPEFTDLVFSVSARYGRANNGRRLHKETITYVDSVKYQIAPTLYPTPSYPHPVHNLNDSRATNKESHTILDFQAGKDIGLGMFGRGGSSELSVGVRFAQFSSHSQAQLLARPDVGVKELLHFNTFGGFDVPLIGYHQFHANADITRSFHGIGPSLSWEGSLPVLGKTDGAHLDIDFGVNGAVLFGRQKVRPIHESSGEYYRQTGFFRSRSSYRIQTYHNAPGNISRSHSVTVPNLGGFLGISMRYPNAKVSFGYRADFFFGAMDGGIDARKTYDRSFHGPFATISLGLGG
jgi:hypothetical protein